MANIVRIKRRAGGGASGAPASLANAELAFNEVDDILYYGKGTGGAGGTATTIDPIGGKGAVVMLTGAQTVAGVKTFSSSPIVPTPVNPTDAANKGYIDTAIVGAGAGDMLKSVYDTNNDGKVNAAVAADAVPWTGVTGKPSVFTPDVHVHSGADITTGTIDIARLPVLPSSIQVVSSGGIAALTSPQQATIDDGSVVTTTDGRRWIYTGTGSKTTEASYIEMADVTPEWTVIANKPSFATVATSGAYADLSGRPTLGTMAAQAASAVAITGGSIDGVTFDGGTF